MNFKLSAIIFIFATSIITQLIPSAIAIPAKTQGQLYIGNFYGRKVYLLPQSIKPRGNLKRFQTRNAYTTQQTDILYGYKYIQSVTYWVANCTEGSIALQQFVDFDSQGKQVGSSSHNLKFEFPNPNDMREKILDTACDYKK